MGGLYLVLFLLSIACFIAGLVKPSLFSGFIKSVSRKKLALIFGVASFLMFGIWGTTLESPKTSTISTESKVNETKSIALTQKEALRKVQDYELQIDLVSPEISKGTTLFGAYEIRGKVPAIENMGWNATEIEDGKYEVSFKQKVGTMVNEPRWEVTSEDIRAVNGAAIKYTPELQRPVETK